MSLAMGLATLLEMVATDNGFDLSEPPQPDWLGFASSRATLRIWLSSHGTGMVAAFSEHKVFKALVEHGTSASVAPLPAGACAARTVSDIPALRGMVRRAFQLSRTLPDEPLHQFQKKIAALPRSTEVERLVVQRVGQDIFRNSLLDYWENRCALTGLSVPPLLRASHIKAWSETTDAERLDVYNGLLLSPDMDAAFDKHFFTLDEGGSVMVSSRLSQADRRVLGLDEPMILERLAEGHRPYLAWHRKKFQAAQN